MSNRLHREELVVQEGRHSTRQTLTSSNVVCQKYFQCHFLFLYVLTVTDTNSALHPLVYLHIERVYQYTVLSTIKIWFVELFYGQKYQVDSIISYQSPLPVCLSLYEN